jgi:formylglycine-generating enzyme required for sulfatase activity
MMGSPSNELARGSDELQHQVTLTRPFMIGKYEVTQEEFQALMGYNPSHFTDCGLNCPVENVTWHEAVAFMNGLSVSQGLEECFDCTNSDSSINCEVKPQYSGQNYYNCKGYRLPTEAEWEYAYRSGTTAAFYNGDITQMGCNPLDPNLDKIGWYCGNAGGKIHPAGDKQANAWDLYDMAGNVGEWVYDWYAPYPSTSPVVDPVGVSNTGSNRVSRGGLWRYGSQSYRAAYRYSDSPNVSNRDLGFRFLRSLPEK